MSHTAWNPLYNTHIPEIDEQHRGLVTIINTLDTMVEAGHEAAGLHDVLIDLVAYAHRHLRDEEALMARYAYPGLARHRDIHATFVRHVNAVDIALRRGEHAGGREMLAFLRDWFLNHIHHTDQHYAAFIAQREPR
jgi:hemerythrin-like metal-binding protein